MAQQIIDGKFSATYSSSESGYLRPAVGYKLHTYVSGTLTPLATYSDSALAVPNTNPVTLDTRGEASVFLGTGTYTLVLKSGTGTTIWTRDGIVTPLSAADLLVSAGSGTIGFLYAAVYGVGTIGRWLHKWGAHTRYWQPNC